MNSGYFGTGCLPLIVLVRDAQDKIEEKIPVCAPQLDLIIGPYRAIIELNGKSLWHSEADADCKPTVEMLCKAVELEMHKLRDVVEALK